MATKAINQSVSIARCTQIPTGYLFCSKGSKGLLEALSIGDYGKRHNIKADFLGFTRELHGVPNMPTAELSEKWVVTISTQYGCSQNCTFCDVPKVPFRGNASVDDLKRQIYDALSLFPGVKYTDRLNLHFARMGEPILNPAVFELTRWLATKKEVFQRKSGLRAEVIHPVLSTSLPCKFRQLKERLLAWCEMKNTLLRGQAGLQLSINSTSEPQRYSMFGGGAITLEELSAIGDELPEPLGRKYCLNFAYSTDFEVDAEKLRNYFDAEKFMVKITPIHNNCACRANGIETVGGYETYAPYAPVESALKNAGFDVLVFVPSMDEEDGLVTCGNLALDDTFDRSTD